MTHDSDTPDEQEHENVDDAWATEIERRMADLPRRPGENDSVV